MRNNRTSLRSFQTVLLLMFLLLTACVTQKKLYTIGKQQMEVGMYNEATETLIKALGKNKSNVEVQLTLRNSAVVVFDQKTDHMASAHQNGQLQEVINSYQELLSLQHRLNNVGVILDIPIRAHTFFNQSKESINEQRNSEAQRALKEKKYAVAERLFRQILALDPTHTDASSGLIIAVNQPVLDEGTALYEQGKYRSAYNRLSRIAGYKNTKDLISLCLERGRARYLFVPEEPISDIFFKTLTEELKKNKTSPFFSPVFYGDYGAIMRKYGISFSDLFSHSSATRTLYDVEKISAIVHVSNYNYKIEKALITRRRYKGFHETVEEIKKEDGTKERKYSYKKVYYTIVSTSRPQQVISEIEVRMIDPKDGRSLYSKNFSLINKDEITYIEYEGDIRSLKAGEWTALNLPIIASKEKVYDKNHSANQLIRNLYSAKRTLPDPSRCLMEQEISIRKEMIKQIVNTTLVD